MTCKYAFVRIYEKGRFIHEIKKALVDCLLRTKPYRAQQKILAMLLIAPTFCEFIEK